MALTLDSSNFDDTIYNNTFVVVGFYVAAAGFWEDDDFTPWYDEVARSFNMMENKVIFAKVDASNDKSLGERYNIHSFPKIVKFIDRGLIMEYKGMLDANEVIDWCNHRTGFFVKPRPDVHEYDVTEFGVDPSHQVAKFFCGATGGAKAMLFIDRESEGARADVFVQTYREVANKYIGKGIHFMLGDSNVSHDAYWFFNLHKGFKGPLIAIRTIAGENYRKENLESEHDIEAFVGDFKAGRLSIPRENIGHMRVNEVSAQSFQKMVMDSGKNVFLELGPWCEWCEPCSTLAPVLDAVAGHYKNHPDVVIANLFYNEPQIQCKGLYDDPYYKDRPTLHLKRASWNKFVTYHGQRTKDCILKFIETNREEVATITIDEIVEIEPEDAFKFGQSPYVIVGFFFRYSGQEYENFCKVARKLKSDYEFRISKTRRKFSKTHREASRPEVLLFTSRNSICNLSQFQMTKAFHINDLLEFIKFASLPNVTCCGEHPQLVVDKFFFSETDKVMLFINRKSVNAQMFASKYDEVAQKYRMKGISPLKFEGASLEDIEELTHARRVSFLIGDLDHSEELSPYLDIEKKNEAFIVIMDLYRDIYMMEGLKPDDIETFVKDYKEGNVDKYKKFDRRIGSTSMVGCDEYFRSDVLESEKNVLLVLYGGGWMYTRELVYVLDDVVKYFEYKKDGDLLVAMMECEEANDDPTTRDFLTPVLHRVKSLCYDDGPTFFFSKKEDRGQIEVYDGDISAKNIIRFVQQQVGGF